MKDAEPFTSLLGSRGRWTVQHQAGLKPIGILYGYFILMSSGSPAGDAMPRLFGAKLALVRRHAGITQTALAQQIPIRQSHISHLEAGRKEPTIDLVVLLTWAFHVSTDYFLQDSIEIEPILSLAVPSTWKGDILRLGEKIQHLRQAHGWSQFELGEQLGLRGQGFVSAIELGRKLPSVELLLRIGEVFELTSDILLLDWMG